MEHQWEAAGWNTEVTEVPDSHVSRKMKCRDDTVFWGSRAINHLCIYWARRGCSIPQQQALHSLRPTQTFMLTTSVPVKHTSTPVWMPASQTAAQGLTPTQAPDFRFLFMQALGGTGDGSND